MEREEEAAKLRLVADKMYRVEFPSGKRGYIFTETFTKDRCIFKKYQVSGTAQLHIGKNMDNQIVVDNPFVSNIHGVLSLSDGLWRITDNISKNGIYVNKKRIWGTVSLGAGDMIYIMGVKIVLGDHFLAINNPDKEVRIHTNLLTEYQQKERRPAKMREEAAGQTYYRSPRLSRSVVPVTLKIQGPPSPAQGDDTPMILAMGPALVMGTASFFTGVLAFLNAKNSQGGLIMALPSAVMSVSMVCGMILFPFLVKVRDRRRKREKEHDRQEKYLSYLTAVRGELKQISAVQKEILYENFPLVTSVMKKKDFYDGALWSRAMGRKNFLTLRVGMGNVPLEAELQFPQERFSIEDDVMDSQVERFRKEKQVVSGVPITFSLLEHKVSGIVGDKKMVYGMLHQILIQIAAYHSYDEVKLVFLCDESRLQEFGYARFLPHMWDDDLRKRFLAVTLEEVKRLSAEFIPILEKRREKNEQVCPHYVFISVSKGLSDRCAFLTELLQDETAKGFSYVAV